MMGAYRIKVVIADAQPVVLSGLEGWFETRERYCVAAMATDAAQLLDAMPRAGADLVVVGGALCVAQADAGDSPLLGELRQRWPEALIVVFTHATDAPTLRALLDAGAAGLASKLDALGEFERVCDRVISGATSVMSKRIAALCQTAPISTPAPTPAPPSNVNSPYGGIRVSVKPFGAAS